jgi:hypothetical protein
MTYAEPPVIGFLRRTKEHRDCVVREMREAHPDKRHTWSNRRGNLRCWCGVRAVVTGFRIDLLPRDTERTVEIPK